VAFSKVPATPAGPARDSLPDAPRRSNW